MKIVSKCGEVQIDLNLLNTEVTMQVEKTPEWLRGKYPTINTLHEHDGFTLNSAEFPALGAMSVCLWGTARLLDYKTDYWRFSAVAKAAEYFGQVQFSLYVTGFKRWDIMAYKPGLKPMLITVTRDEKYINALAIELEIFVKQLNEVVEQIRSK